MVDRLFAAGTSRGWFGFSGILLAAGLAFAFLTLVVSPTRAQTTGAQATGAQTTETQVTSADSPSREAGAPPYPILFVHGLASSADVWKESQEGLSVFGKLRSRWGEAQRFRVNLNADNNDEECSLSEDVRFGTESLSDGNLFAMDFDYDQAGSPYSASPYSDESAIIKQGKALSRAISEVLMATGEEKVVLVGHSMGGLAIREYLQRRGPGGEPRWWVDSGLESGHRVARVVTIGTPHYGTNTDFADIVSPFSKSEADTARTQGQVPAFPFNSEAIRDLRRSYEYPSSEKQGRYLYGGREGWPVSSLTGWSNTDVNCDGTEDDVITGINEVGLSSLEMPLPKDISYTWVTSDCTGGPNLFQQCSDAGYEGDGVVKLANQYLKTESGGSYPGGISDTLLISKYHTYETGDVTGILRGIDEPGRRDLAYSFPTDQPEGTYTDGYFTAPPIDTSGSFVFTDDSTDFDVYRPEGVETGSMTITLPSPPSSFSSVFASENGITAGVKAEEGTGETIRLTVSTTGGEEHAIYAKGHMSNTGEADAYSIRADTRSLRHFTYQPRHGSFADTTQQGFASLRVPEGVPKVGGDPLSEEDEIGVFTPGGTCVGAAVWAGAPTYVSAFGNRQGGLQEGDSLRVRIWDRSAQTEYATTGTLSGDGRYEPGETLVARQLSADLSPSEPSGLAAEVRGSTVDLGWEAVSNPGADSYRIYRDTTPIDSSSGPSGQTPIGSVKAGTIQYSDTDATPGTKYYYRVTAVDADGNESSFSGEASAYLQPEVVEASVARTFGEASGPRDYRLVALPGAPDTSLAASVSGEAGAEWQAYREAGDDLKRYRSSAEEEFSFRKGRGYWLTSRQEWTLEGPVESASLQDSTTSVPLNSGGWTIVANPFGEAVSFSALNRANGGDLQALWPFGGAFSDTSAVFKSARQGQAYYLFSEDPSRDSLQVPHPALTDGSGKGSSETQALQATSTKAASTKAASAKAASAKAAAPAPVALSARPVGEGEVGPRAASTVRVGIAGERGPGTLRAPPGGLERVSLRVVRGGQKESGQKAGEQGEEKRLLMADRRRAEGEGETFRLRLESQVEGPIQIQARGADSLGARSAALIDRSEKTTYDLSRDGPIQITPGQEKRRLEVVVGSKSYVEGKREEAMPEKVRLTSYPNPAGRRATIEYALPEAREVTLQVYDVLGRRVATLEQGRKKAGRHTARLETSRLSSGVYFGRLEAGEQTRTQKITVVR